MDQENIEEGNLLVRARSTRRDAAVWKTLPKTFLLTAVAFALGLALSPTLNTARSLSRSGEGLPVELFEKNPLALVDKKPIASDPCLGAPFPFNRTTLQPVADVPLPKNAVFLSCVHTIDTNSDSPLECYFRTHFDGQGLSKVILDKHFNLASNVNNHSLPGEDPRVFRWNNRTYVVDNYKGKMKIMQIPILPLEKVESWYLPKSIGKRMKNISPIPINDLELWLVDFDAQSIFSCQKPLDKNTTTGFYLDCNDNPLPDVHWNYEAMGVEEKPVDWHYRGGSPGYKVSPNEYVGFGHITENQKGWTKRHETFVWKLNRTEQGVTVLMNLVGRFRPTGHLIRDATSMVCVDGDWFVFTAESEQGWKKGMEMLFVQRVYRVIEDTAPVSNVTTTFGF